MARRILLLSGIAILAVVLSHTAGFGQVALLEWREIYHSDARQGFEPFRTPQYYVFLCIRQLVCWAVPAFFFVAGFFVAYASRGSRGAFTWKMARNRVIGLLGPYLFWCSVWYVLDALRGVTFTPTEYLLKLLTGTADNYGSYFFVIVLIQFYALSPLLVSAAKARPRILLLTSALLHVLTLGVAYLAQFASSPPALHRIVQATSQSWLPFRQAFWFPFGLVCGLESTRLRRWLGRYRSAILPATVALGLAAIAEPEAIYRVTGADWRWSARTLSTACYSAGFILSFFTVDQIPIPSLKFIQKIGQKSYGIYLIHLRAIHLVARIVYEFMPALLAHQVTVLAPLLFTSGLVIPLLFMASLAKSSARRYYRYVFG